MSSITQSASGVDEDETFFVSYLTDLAADLALAVKAVGCAASDVEAWKKIQTIAHKLKGSAPLYGRIELASTARRAETAIRTCEDVSLVYKAVRSLAEHVEAECDPIESRASSDCGKRVAGQGTDPATSMRSLARVEVMLEDQMTIGYLMRHFEGIADIVAVKAPSGRNHNTIEQSPDLRVFEHSACGIDGLARARDVIAADPHAGPSCLVAFHPGVQGRCVAEAVSIGAHTILTDPDRPRALADRILSLLDLTRKTVLVVEDDAPVRRVLENAYTSIGVKCDSVRDGVDALEYLKTSTPDLIILDSMMPRLDGMGTLHEIQTMVALKDIPVIVLTAEAKSGAAARWFVRGAADFIAKPFDPDEVVARSKRYLLETLDVK